MSSSTRVPESTFLYGHTCLGYARFTNAAQAGKPLHEHTDLQTNQCVLTIGQSSCYRYCPECARDDVAEWGCSYLRRYHQLPGIDQCDHHEVALTEMSRAVVRSACLDRLPDVQATARRGGRDHPAVRRFFELSMMALRGSTPVHPEHLAGALTGRAQAMGLRVREQKSGPRFSELVRQQIPADWLAKHFGSTKPENTMDGIIRAYRSPYRTACYLLAMAVLWDSPKEAMAACAGRTCAGTSATTDSVGTRMINAVLAGASIRAACRQERGCVSDLETALRRLLGSRVDEPAREVTT